MPNYQYDQDTLEYTSEDETVDRDETLEIGAVLISGASALARRWSEELAAGDITLIEWLEQMQVEIKDSHIQQYLLGRGGLAQMGTEDWALLGDAINGQYGYLANFAAEIEAGELSGAMIAARAGMYMAATKVAYGLGHKLAAQAAGRTEVRWMEADVEHCPDCNVLAALGWVPIGELPTMPGAGATQCMSNCQCHLKFR